MNFKRKLTTVAFVLGACVGTLMPTVIRNAEASNTGHAIVTTEQEQAMCVLEQVDLTSEDMTALAEYVDSETVRKITEELGSTTPEAYVEAFIREVPGFAEKFMNYIQ